MQKLLATMDRRKTELLTDAAAWKSEALLFRPQPTSWCALDVLDHLARTEAAVAQSVLSNTSPVALSARDIAGSLLVYAAMYTPSRIKLPPGAEVVIPQTPSSLKEAADAWQTARQLVAQIVQSSQQNHARGGVFKHPVGGWMSAEGTLRFLDSHLAHHVFQWKRLRREASLLN